MLQQSVDPRILDIHNDYPIIDLEYTLKGVLRKKWYSKELISIQFIRIAAITFPKKQEIYAEKQLPKQTSKTIKDLRYNKSGLIDERAAYMRLRNNYLLHNQSTIDDKAIRDKSISTYLSQLIKNKVHIHIINSPEENNFLVIGVEYSQKLYIHPRSDVQRDITTNLVNQHYVVDHYPNLIGMKALIKVDQEGQISFFQSTKYHQQMQPIDRTIIYRLIEKISKLSKIGVNNYDEYTIDGFGSQEHNSCGNFAFELYSDNNEKIHYSQLPGTSLAVLADQDIFQSWLLNYSFYNEYEQSDESLDLKNRIIVLGGPKPLGYTEMTPDEFRVDFLEIIRNNPSNVWVPVFSLMNIMYSYLVKRDVAADFNQAWSDIRNSQGELMSQINNFDKLVQKLKESFENEINLTDDPRARFLLSVFNQIKLLDCFNKSDTDLNLSKRLFIPTNKYSSKDLFLLLFTLVLRANLDDDPIDSIVINDYDLSELILKDKVRLILDNQSTGFNDTSKVHRTYRISQVRYNHIPRIILSYNREVRSYLSKNRFTEYEKGKERIQLFERSCILLPDQPLRRIFVNFPSENLINSVISLERTMKQSSIELDDVNIPMEESTVETEEVEIDHPIEMVHDDVETQDTIQAEPRIESEIENIRDEGKEIDQMPIGEEIIKDKEDRTIKTEKEPESIKPHDISIHRELSKKIEPALKEGSLVQYTDVFDIEFIFTKLVHNKPEMDMNLLFQQIDTMISYLENLNDCYLAKELEITKTEYDEREMIILLEEKLITVHPKEEKFSVELTTKGSDVITDALKYLNDECNEIEDLGIDIQKILMNNSELMEQFRQQGKIKSEAALLSWPKLLALAYYDKFSKLAPVAHGINVRVTKIIEKGIWIENHDEFIKTFMKQYQTELYNIEKEILTFKAPVLKKGDLTTLPTIKVTKPKGDEKEVEKINRSGIKDETDETGQIVTHLGEYDEFDDKKSTAEIRTDHEQIEIVTYEIEEEEKKVVKPRKTKAGRERAAKELIKSQKEKFQEIITSNELEDDFNNFDEETIDATISHRVATVKDDKTKSLYFFQPSWDTSIDQKQHNFNLATLPLSLFNFKTKTKKMLSGVLEDPTVGELMKVNVDWKKLPSIGKKTHEEITEFKLIFENWSKLKGSEIFAVMSRSGLDHLFEQKIYFEPKNLPDNILLPLHVNLKTRYTRKVDEIINNMVGQRDDIEISREIINTICKDLCNVLEIEVEEDHAEIKLHKINKFQKKNFKMSKAQTDPIFDLTWILKFDNYNDQENKEQALSDLKDNLSRDLDNLILPYQVQNTMLDLEKTKKAKKKIKKKTKKKTKRRQLA